jgi:hypothetical protein
MGRLINMVSIWTVVALLAATVLLTTGHSIYG